LKQNEFFFSNKGMEKQIFILSEKERREKKISLEALIPVEAMPLELVPEIFYNPSEKNNEILKKRIEWAFSQVKRKIISTSIGKISITKRGIRDSLRKGVNKYKAGLYSCLDKLIEISVHLFTNTDSNGKRQFILGSKYSRGGKIAYVGIVVKEDIKGKKYYSHTIYEKNGWRPQAVSEKTDGAKKLHPATKSILHEILSVNNNLGRHE